MDTPGGNQDTSEQRVQFAASLKAFMLKSDTKSNVNV